ncbi:hypothetical protein C5F52_05115 [Limnohabitans sp. TS-CS-82]|jgi:hypothetical protein|uniref:hypothetical protein n=1 Tax=Limnohabitans sp. TS-CS-82 TaxID=2094193 RepID=UPI000CF2E094|nr:hypothetical protein [Limnohabitans sp. TS-CS-82]PQA83845.1 hypothetical protein C5F52_05115 [Limnohabitans sp. TS-CS-82]
MRKSTYKVFSIVFWSTLVLYLITLATVSYVGVYLTYVALPIIVISGMAAYFLEPKITAQKEMTPQDRIDQINARLKDLEN